MKTGVSIQIMTSKLLSQKKNKTRTTQSIKTVETEITSTEPLKIIVSDCNDSDTRSRKSNQLYTGDKSSDLNDTKTSQNKGGTIRKKTRIVGDSIVKNIKGW